MVESPRPNEEAPQGGDQGDLNALSQRIRDAKIAAGLEMPEETKSVREEASPLARIGSDFVATVLACIGMGWLVDYQFDTAPWGLLIMLFCGVLVGGMNIWRVMNGIKPTVEWRAEDNKRKK